MRKRLLLATLGTAPALAALTAGSPALGAITATLFTTSTLGESVNVNKSVLLLAKGIVSPASTVTCAGWKPLGPSPTYFMRRCDRGEPDQPRERGDADQTHGAARIGVLSLGS